MPRPTWGRAFAGALWGYALAAFATLAAGVALNALWANPWQLWSAAWATDVFLGAGITAVCLRLAVRSASWRIISWPSAIVAGILFSPGWLVPNLLALVAVAVFVRYRSLPDAHHRPSVGLRLMPGEVDKVVSRH
jgi:hypothetical protein